MCVIEFRSTCIRKPIMYVISILCNLNLREAEWSSIKGKWSERV